MMISERRDGITRAGDAFDELRPIELESLEGVGSADGATIIHDPEHDDRWIQSNAWLERGECL